MTSIKYVVILSIFSAITTAHAAIISAVQTDSTWLIQYDLNAPSGYSSEYYPSDSSFTPYSGTISVIAPAALIFDGLNNFSVYLDDIDQSVQISEYDQFGGTDRMTRLDLGLTTADALAGTASYRYSGTGWGDDIPTTSGDLTVYNEIFTCIECGIDITINLLGLDYSSGQLIINPNLNTNQTLLTESEFYGYGDAVFTNEFYVTPVPVPTAFWLFSSGLFALEGISRKYNASNTSLSL